MLNLDEQQRRYLLNLFSAVLQRAPSERELNFWLERLSATTPYAVLEAFVKSKEFRNRLRVSVPYHAGHYYSPVVDPSTVKDYVTAQRRSLETDIPGIPIDREEMLAVWNRNLPFMLATPDHPTKVDRRYFHEGSGYPRGDAIFLRGIISELKPRRIIEIGSGFSTACMLDAIDDLRLRCQVTCIEPYPDRLLSLLSSPDEVTLLQMPVQDVELALFTELDAGDILFVDSTHVMKTGSDVHFELFSILPVIPPGVWVHFHDIPYPFEYPDDWIYIKNYSWNEAYGLRAFLMYNANFKVTFWSNLFVRTFRNEIARDFPNFPRNPGTGIWLKREF